MIVIFWLFQSLPANLFCVGNIKVTAEVAFITTRIPWSS